MSPAQVREALIQRALLAHRTAEWLASAAHIAIAFERGEDGSTTARGPTEDEVRALERHAVGLDAREVDSALAILRGVGGAT